MSGRAIYMGDIGREKLGLYVGGGAKKRGIEYEI